MTHPALRKNASLFVILLMPKEKDHCVWDHIAETVSNQSALATNAASFTQKDSA